MSGLVADTAAPAASTGAAPAATSAAELAGRIVVSCAACTLLSWQLVETVGSRPSGRCPGTPLQWYLLTLMMLSVLEGVVGVIADLALVDASGSLPAEAIVEEVSLSIMLSKVGEAIVSLMIVGLGVDAWLRGHRRAWLATTLGLASLVSRRLPAPLVLVGGIFCLQRAPKVDAAPEGRRGCSCCSLRCALQPLLALALLEAVYAGFTADETFRANLDRAKQDTVKMFDRAHVEMDDQSRKLLIALQPTELIELAQQQLGELVELGVVLALGLTGHAHGLRHTRLPIVAAFVPGLPLAFAVVFYFLLETRQVQTGGTLLPV